MTTRKRIRPALPGDLWQRRGFSLLEVMIGLAVFAIAIVAVMGALRQGRKMLVEPDKKAEAWSQAQSALEKTLAMSYAQLANGETPGSLPKPCSVQVNCTTMNAPVVPGVPTTPSDIPYCAVTASCTYTEENEGKTVSLAGIVPYPYMQIFSLRRDPFTETPPVTIIAGQPTGTSPNGTNVLTLTFTPEVKSNLMIFYDITIDVANLPPVPAAAPTNELRGTDLLLTRCYLNGGGRDPDRNTYYDTADHRQCGGGPGA